MRYKRKTYKKRLGRKRDKSLGLIGEWSRMLHRWWKVDLYNKHMFKKGKEEY